MKTEKRTAHIIALCAIALLCLLGSRVSATPQPPDLLKDIYPAEQASSPDHFTPANSLMFFSATSPSEGRELWKSDGTSSGTTLVSDLYLGSTDSSPEYLTPYNGKLYFVATELNFGREIFYTDGTTVTNMKDIVIGTGLGSNPQYLAVANGKLFFNADPGGGDRLYISDGTDAGTFFVDPPGSATYVQSPRHIVSAGNKVYFVAENLSSANTLWMSDGTAAGTVTIMDFNSYVTEKLTVVGNKVFFNVNDESVNGIELWVSDGSAPGTFMLKDINPGVGDSYPDQHTNVNGELFFTADNPATTGTELWKTDGTAAGTGMVKDIYPGTTCSYPLHLVNHNGILFFSAEEPDNGRELWRSDGTAAGTVLVKDINPGTGNGMSAISSMKFLSYNDVLYFVAETPGEGSELWQTDGTDNGTLLINDTNPGPSPGIEPNLGFFPTLLGRNMFYKAKDGDTTGATGYEPWLLLPNSPPSSSNTTLSMDQDTIHTFIDSDFPYSDTEGDAMGGIIVKQLPAKGTLVVNGTAVYVDQYISSSEILDGLFEYKPVISESGTPYTTFDFIIKDEYGAYSSTINTFTFNVLATNQPPIAADGSVSFPKNYSYHFQLSDFNYSDPEGDPLDAIEITQLPFFGSFQVAGRNVVLGDVIARQSIVDGVLTFNPAADTHGIPLTTFGFKVRDTFNWGTDTYTMTINVEATGVNQPPVIDPIPDYEVFVNSGQTSIPLTGISDGNDGNQTISMTVISDNPGLISPTVNYVSPESTGSLTFTPAANSEGKAKISLELKDDGGLEFGGRDTYLVSFMVYVYANPIMLKDINPGGEKSDIMYITRIGDALLFRADDGTHGPELWRTDGTKLGTKLLEDIAPGAEGSYPYHFTRVGDILYFSASDGEHGYELGRSNGTPEGTFMVKQIGDGVNGSDPYNLTNVNGLLFFCASGTSKKDGLWLSDGTAAQTNLLTEFTPFPLGVYPAYLTNLNGLLCFIINNGTNGYELWRSNGTTAGTDLILDINPGEGHSLPIGLYSVGDKLFFAANDGKHGYELWRSDGTSAGTKMIKDIAGSGNSFPTNFVDVNGTLFFCAYTPTYGYELWKSDGSTAGTILVKDINPGSESSDPYDLINVNGELYFAANDGTHGVELWKSDGTKEGTILVKDINPGEASSRPYDLIDAHEFLCFNADDGTHGRELWITDTAAGTTSLAVDIWPGSESSEPTQFTIMNGSLYFVADNGKENRELWKYVLKASSATQVQLTTYIYPEHSGVISPSNGKTVSLSRRLAKTIKATANDGYKFIQWQPKGQVKLFDAFAAQTAITVSSKSEVTAIFAKEKDVVRIQFTVSDRGYGLTSPSGTVSLIKKQSYQITATPNSGFVFTGWQTADNILINNSYSATTKMTPLASGVIKANFAKSEISTDGKERIMITAVSQNTGTYNVNLMNFELPQIATGTSAENVSLLIEGTRVPLAKTRWQIRDNSWKYSDGTIRLMVNWDKQKWSFKASELSLPEFDNSNGIDIILTLGNHKSAVNFKLTEKTKWVYCDQKSNIPSQSLTLFNQDLEKLNITKASGGNNKFSIQGVLPVSNFSSENDNINITINNLSYTIPANSLTEKGTGNYSYKTSNLKLTMNLNKRNWSIKVLDMQNDKLDTTDGVTIYLTIGSNQTGTKIFPVYKSTYSYQNRR